jgi:serine/threonine-protein kinase
MGALPMASGPVKLNPSLPFARRPESLEVNVEAPPWRDDGKAAIWVARDESLGRKVHFVLLNRHLGSDPTERQAFVRRAQMLAQLEHPHIVPIYAIGEHHDDADPARRSIYLTMKRTSGATLADTMESKSFKSYSRKEIYGLMQVLVKVCDAVHYAHDRGVIHRNLAPHNILLGDYGQVYVGGWDQALLLLAEARPDGDDEVVAHPAYVAPEVALGMGQRVDERSDVFALGACLYELLTGTPPFGQTGAAPEAILEEAARCKPIPPHQKTDHPLPMYLCRIVSKAMACAAEERYQSAHELKADIECFLQTHSFFPQVSFDKGSLIIKEGEFGDAAYIIIDGQAEVFTSKAGRKKRIRLLKEGDTFGEIAVFSSRPRTANVQAKTPLTAIRITQEQLRNEDGLGYWLNLFNKALAERFVEKEKRVARLEKQLKALKKG